MPSKLATAEDVISFVADVAGVLVGAFLGYLLGLRQQRKIDSERDEKKRDELTEALRAELEYLVKEVTAKSLASSGVFGSLNFDVVVLDLPTFTSIVNSGQLLLLDMDIISELRELNTKVHEHNTAQAIFLGVGGALSSTASARNSDELNAMLESPNEEVDSRLGGLLRLIIHKREEIAQSARKLIQDLS